MDLLIHTCRRSKEPICLFHSWGCSNIFQLPEAVITKQRSPIPTQFSVSNHQIGTRTCHHCHLSLCLSMRSCSYDDNRQRCKKREKERELLWVFSAEKNSVGWSSRREFLISKSFGKSTSNTVQTKGGDNPNTSVLFSLFVEFILWTSKTLTPIGRLTNKTTSPTPKILPIHLFSKSPIHYYNNKWGHLKNCPIRVGSTIWLATCTEFIYFWVNTDWNEENKGENYH